MSGNEQAVMHMVSGSQSDMSPSITPNRMDDDSRRDNDEISATRSKMSLKSREDENTLREPNELLIATRKAIQEGRSKNKVIGSLHEQLDQFGVINGYDKEQIGQYMNGLLENIDVSGEETFANIKVKMKHDKPPELEIQQTKQSEDPNNTTDDNARLNAKYDHKDLANGPWSQRGRGSVNQYKIDFDFSKYRLDGKRAKLDPRPDINANVTETFRDKKKMYHTGFSNKMSFDHNFQSTTTESPRLGNKVRKGRHNQAKKVHRVFSGSQAEANGGDPNVVSSPTSNTSNSHIGKMNWVYMPSRQHANETDIRQVNTSTLTSVPKIRFAQHKTNQIQASIKMALNQEIGPSSIPRTSYQPHRMKHQHVLSGSMFDNNKDSCLSNPLQDDSRMKGYETYNNSQLSQTQLNQASQFRQQSKRSHKKGSQWKSMTDAQNIFSPRSVTNEPQFSPQNYFPARGNLNMAIQTLGLPLNHDKQVLLNNQQSPFQQQRLNDLASPLQLRRTLLGREATQHANKPKKHYQPQMSIQQVRNTIQEKAMAAANSIKFRKQRINMPMYQQLLQLRSQPGKLAQFFQSDKLQVVTEEEVKAGMCGFQVLIDPMKIKEISAEIDKQRKRAKLNIQKTGGDEQQEQKEEMIDPLSGKKIEVPEVKQEQDEKDPEKQLGIHLAASMVPGLDKAENIKIKEELAMKLEDKLKQVENKEMNIINELYRTHFPGVHEEESRSTDLAGPSNHIQQNDPELMTQSDAFQNLSNESKQILKEHLAPPKGYGRFSMTKPNTKDNLSKIYDDMDLEILRDKQMVKYVQYVPKKLGNEHVDLDSAIKSLYTLKMNNISPTSPRPKFGSQFTTNSGNEMKLSTRFDKVKGFIYGPQGSKCQHKHVHSRECSKIKDIDIAQVQTLAFQFMLLQKPEFAKGVASEDLQASFFPAQSKLSKELSEAYKEIEKLRQMSTMSDIKMNNIFKKLQKESQAGMDNDSKLLPGQKIDVNDIPSCQRLQYFVKQLIDSEEGTSALEEKLRQIVNTINLRENSILKNKVRQQARMRMPDVTESQIHPTKNGIRPKIPGNISGSQSLERDQSLKRSAEKTPELINIETYNRHPAIVSNLSPISAGHKHSQKLTLETTVSPQMQMIQSPLSADGRCLKGTDGLSPLHQNEYLHNAQTYHSQMPAGELVDICKKYTQTTEEANGQDKEAEVMHEMLDTHGATATGTESGTGQIVGEDEDIDGSAIPKSAQQKHSKNNSVPHSVKNSDICPRESAHQQYPNQEKPQTPVRGERRTQLDNRAEKQSDLTLPTYQSQRVESDINMSMVDQTIVQNSKDKDNSSMQKQTIMSQSNHQNLYINTNFQTDQTLCDPKFIQDSSKEGGTQYLAIPNGQTPVYSSHTQYQQTTDDSLLHPDLQANYIHKSVLETESPLSNENIRMLTHKELALSRKAWSRVVEDQRKLRNLYKEYVGELRRLEKELETTAKKVDENETKLVWRSPFEHRQNQKHLKKVEIESKRIENLEKVQFMPQYKQQKQKSKFNQWSMTDLNKREVELRQLIQQYKQKIVNVVTVDKMLQQKEQDLRYPPSSQQTRLQLNSQNQSSLGANEGDTSPQKFKYQDNKYPPDDLILEQVESERQSAPAESRDKHYKKIKSQKMSNIPQQFSGNYQPYGMPVSVHNQLENSPRQRIQIPIQQKSHHASDNLEYGQQVDDQPQPTQASQDEHETGDLGNDTLVPDMLQTQMTPQSTLRRNNREQDVPISGNKFSEVSSIKCNNTLDKITEGFGKVNTTNRSPTNSHYTMFDTRLKMNISPAMLNTMNVSPTYQDQTGLEFRVPKMKAFQMSPGDILQSQMQQQVDYNLRQVANYQPMLQENSNSKQEQVTKQLLNGKIQNLEETPGFNGKGGSGTQQSRKKKENNHMETASMVKTHKFINDLSSPKGKTNKVVRKSPINNLDLASKYFDEERDLLSSQRQQRKPTHRIGSNKYSYLPKKMMKTGPVEDKNQNLRPIQPAKPQIDAQEILEGHKPTFSPRNVVQPSKKQKNSPGKNQINVVMNALRNQNNESFGAVSVNVEPTSKAGHYQGQFKARLNSRGSNYAYRGGKKAINQASQKQSFSPQKAILNERTIPRLMEQGTLMRPPPFNTLEVQNADSVDVSQPDLAYTREMSHDNSANQYETTLKIDRE